MDTEAASSAASGSDIEGGGGDFLRRGSFGSTGGALGLNKVKQTKIKTPFTRRRREAPTLPSRAAAFSKPNQLKNDGMRAASFFSTFLVNMIRQSVLK